MGYFMKIAVLTGGNSLEREISLAAGEACAMALLEEGYDAKQIDVGPDLPQQLEDFRPEVELLPIYWTGSVVN